MIELIIVITILGLLGVVLMTIINPAERIAQARDSGRISAVVQLGKAVESYYIRGSTYPDPLTWNADLVAAGYPNKFPSGIPYLAFYGVSNCQTNVFPSTNPSYCYNLDSSDSNGAIVFIKLEATVKSSLCSSSESVYFVYSTADKKTGLFARTTNLIPGQVVPRVIWIKRQLTCRVDWLLTIRNKFVL